MSTLRFLPLPLRKGSPPRQITFFAPTTPGRLQLWREKRTKSGSPLPASSDRSSITNGKGGTVRAACTPLKSSSAGMVAVTKGVDPIRFGQAGSLAIGTRVSTQLQGGSRRRTITSIKSSEQFGTFDFGTLPTLPVFQASFFVTPAMHGRPRYRTRDASPPLDEDTSLTETDHRGGTLRTWLVEAPKAFIGRTQGRCGAAKEFMNDVLRRSVEEASKRTGTRTETTYPRRRLGS
jgi:hypothetical protein